MAKNQKDQPKASKDVLLEALSHIGKLVSIALIVVLVVVGLFLVYYVVSTNFLKSDNGGNPKFSVYTIVSGSMEPNIKVYDVIIDIRVDDPSKIKIGDVITFVSTSTISKDMVVTHRVIDIRKVDDKLEFVTKGDNNPIADSTTALAANLIGKTVLRIPQLGRLQFFLSSKFGWIVAILIPALGVIIYDIIKLFKVLGVKGTSEQVEGTDVDYITKNEEDKKIAETFEKIKKNKNFTSLDEHTFEFKIPPVNEAAEISASLRPGSTIDDSSFEVKPAIDEVVIQEAPELSPSVKIKDTTMELPKLIEDPNLHSVPKPVSESKPESVTPTNDDPFAVLNAYVDNQSQEK